MTELKQDRLLSLDVFRGLTIAGMILVNNPGTWSAIYPSLKHAAWHGCTPTDLIFPFFLFIVGVAITLSLTKRKERGDNMSKLYLQIFRRGVILIGLGLILSIPTSLFVSDGKTISEIIDGWRIPGVLQRIGVVYIIAAIMFLKMSAKNLAIWGGIILIAYCAVLSFIPVPGIGYANFEYKTNLPAYIDRLILGNHIWVKGNYDPEGLLSTLPAIATAIMGILTGVWIRKEINSAEKTVWLFVMGTFAMFAGYVWDGWFPMNKPIWTSSYVLYTGGLALIFLAMCYWLIDVKGYKQWTKPFIVYGTNAITVFFASGVVGRALTIIKVEGGAAANLLFESGVHKKLMEEISLKDYLFANLYLSWLSPINASFAYALVYIFIWLGLMWILYAKKIFIKV